MKNIIKRILREQLNPIKWVKPDYEDEEEEFELTASEIGDDYEETLSSLINGYWNSTIEVLTDEEWSQMENTDSWGLETEEAIYNVIGGYGRSNERILKHSLEPLRNGGVVETPIVVYSDGNPPYLVAGNTRLSACKVLGITPMVTKIYL